MRDMAPGGTRWSASSPAGALGALRAHYRQLASTNERASELAEAGAPHGTLVTASEQTAGRGRQGREWWAPPGDSLLMSLVLREAPALLPLAAAVAVCDAVADADGEQVRIKWPNDIVLARAREHVETPTLPKLAGILIERRPPADWTVLGIGVNVAVSPGAVPVPLRSMVASLGWPREAIEPLTARLLEALARRLADPPERVLDAWRAHDALRGRAISWTRGPQETAGESALDQGRAEGIDGEGRLVVARADGGRVTLEAGEVHLLAEPDAA
jgi:BirA family biotin operon repressor/biotin-[acetyl-CoA-carboxylase] ligase